MMTIISGTNRHNSEALQFARHYQQVLAAKTAEPIKLLALENIPHDWFHPGMYDDDGQSATLAALQDEYILPAGKFIFIVPEYNGGMPGALKLFLDACSIRRYRDNFSGKKAAMTGIAAGRSGNLRGMDHLAGILNHMGAVVFPKSLPLSGIEKLMDGQGNISDIDTLAVIERQIDSFLNF
ncbi:MAG: NADPH-dependent oxidoreductase [Saprospiraceae bacterium]|nr:MAG: NADPH-dependent oxidoreductase [Saprospiraceae bacterium]